MPLYEYQCLECKEVFHELRNGNEREHPIECPDCGGAGRVLISRTAPAKTTRNTRPAGGCTGGT